MDASIITRLLFVLSIATIFYCTGIQAQTKVVDTVIGIDLGTTYTCVGVFKGCHVEIIENDQGNRITPSYVAFKSNGERLIGDTAKNLLTTNPQSKFYCYP
jgi:molecular chaperone DnaK (HSP70)